MEAMTLSIALETTCLVGLGWWRCWMPRPDLWRWLLAGAAVTLITHPFAWEYSTTHTPALTAEAKALRIEGAVVAVEALLYAATLRVPPLRAIALSLLANGVSFSAGFFV